MNGWVFGFIVHTKGIFVNSFFTQHWWTTAVEANNLFVFINFFYFQLVNLLYFHICVLKLIHCNHYRNVISIWTFSFSCVFFLCVCLLACFLFFTFFFIFRDNGNTKWICCQLLLFSIPQCVSRSNEYWHFYIVFHSINHRIIQTSEIQFFFSLLMLHIEWIFYVIFYCSIFYLSFFCFWKFFT